MPASMEFCITRLSGRFFVSKIPFSEDRLCKSSGCIWYFIRELERGAFLFPIEQVVGVLIALVVIAALFAIVFFSKRVGGGAEKIVHKLEKEMRDGDDIHRDEIHGDETHEE